MHSYLGTWLGIPEIRNPELGKKMSLIAKIAITFLSHVYPRLPAMGVCSSYQDESISPFLASGLVL